MNTVFFSVSDQNGKMNHFDNTLTAVKVAAEKAKKEKKTIDVYRNGFPYASINNRGLIQSYY